MLPVMKLNVVLSDDRTKATLTLFMDEQPLGHIILEAPDVEDLIHTMSAVRASMSEQVPNEIEPGARLLTIVDPIWRTKLPADAPNPGVMLALRHPGLGWLANLLPPLEAQDLGQSLLDLSRAPSP